MEALIEAPATRRWWRRTGALVQPLLITIVGAARVPRRHRSVAVLAALAVLLVVGLVGCGHSTTVPDGGQQVHVVTAGSEVRLEPASVRAGDIYLVLDEPTTNISLVQRRHTAEATPGPMTNDDLTRIAQGDEGGTSIEGFENSQCEETRRAADRGQLMVPGGCGNVFKVTVPAGRYAILLGGPPMGVPPPIAVLEVLP